MKKHERRNSTLQAGLAKAPSDTGLQQGDPTLMDAKGRIWLERGELAINNNKDDPCIWLRDTDDKLVKFRPTVDIRWVDSEADLALIVAKGTPPRAGDAYIVRHPLSSVPAQDRLVVWDPSIAPPGFTGAAGPGGVPPGDWNWQVTQRVYRRALRSEPIPAGAGADAYRLVDGDLLFTEEAEHQQIHIWTTTASGSAWLKLWDVDELRLLARRDRGLNIVGRRSDLPIPAQGQPIFDGQEFLVRMDFAGQPLNRVYAWRELTPETPMAAQIGEWISEGPRNWIFPLRTDPDPLTDREPGDLRMTLERDHEELKTFDGTAWQRVYSSDQVKAWIAALNLFEGTTSETGHAVGGAVLFDALPDLTSTDPVVMGQNAALAAHYYTFVGTPGYEIKPADVAGIGRDLSGVLLNPGDWLQVVNKGTDVAPDIHWVVIGGDLLAKSRGDLLYGLKPWTAGSWEQGSLVLHDGDLYRALRGVVAADPQPNVVVTPPATQPWELVPISGGMKIAQVDPGGGTGALPISAPPGQVWIVLNSAVAGGKQALFAYDAGAQKWVELGGGGIPLDLSGGVELIGVGLPIGSIIAFCNIKPPPGWLLCNGQVCPAIYKEIQPYLWDGKVPDLRGQFIMGSESDANDQIMSFTRHQDTTRLPRKDFKARHPGATASIPTRGGDYDNSLWNTDSVALGAGSDRHSRDLVSVPAVDMTVTGGDPITRPPHTILAYIIKVADRFVRERITP